MVVSHSNKVRVTIFAVVSGAIIIVSALIMNSTFSGRERDLVSLGVTLDLALGIPLLYYFFISRKFRLPAVTVLVVFLICIGIASLVLPAGNQFYLDNVKSVLVVAELILVSHVILKARSIVSTYRSLTATSWDFVHNLRTSFHRVMGERMVSSVLASEISMIRYGLFGWALKKEIHPGEASFATHVKSGYVTVWVVFIFVVVVELFAVHLLLWRWGSGIAIAATALSAYGLVFLVADLVSLVKRPVAVSSDRLFVRVGIRWNSTVELKKIRAVEIIRNFDKGHEPGTLDCSILRDPNIRISCSEPVVVYGLYGIRKYARAIAFNVDDVEKFVTVVLAAATRSAVEGQALCKNGSNGRGIGDAPFNPDR